jgi:hypothetical protein
LMLSLACGHTKLYRGKTKLPSNTQCITCEEHL